MYKTCLDLQPLVEEVAVLEVVLEFSGTSENYACDVDSIVGDEKLSAKFSHFGKVVMPFFQTETSKPQGRLTTATVLFGKLHTELVDDLASVAEYGAEEAAVAVHDDESKLLIILEQFGKRFDVEFVVAKVERSIYGPERLKIYCHLTLLAIIGHHSTAIKHESIGGHLAAKRDSIRINSQIEKRQQVGGQSHLVIQFQTLRCRRNCGQDALTVHARFDV